ncbi:MAG: 4-hydroxythreonine-4-phosphate dehydrogenase PdxA [Rhodospirillales bacterium]|nr:4-hydroxythreonine-4-phosphate dehydrogenase PdxA [Rhodospirillales bacterium]
MMTAERPRVAVTIGDPAGIGPEIALKALAHRELYDFSIPVVFGNAKVLEANKSVAGVTSKIRAIADASEARGEAGTVDVVEVGSLSMSDFKVGEGSAVTGAFSGKCLETAIGCARKGVVRAVVQGPASKQAQNAGGYKFAGFRETANAMAGCDDTILITLGKVYNLTRVTTHVPLSDVPRLCSRQAVLRVIQLTHKGMKAVGYERPRIGVAGLNPHCGEGGLMGREEIEQIIPAIEDARAEGIVALGPYPGDTVFLNMKAGEFDVIISMYHDHGNACIKLAEFGTLFNLLAGAPFPILTVHHGTAFDIAGKGLAGETNLLYALYIAAGHKVPA